MYLVFGQRPYGKCDVIPELFYVATWFFHIDYLPLIPLGTRVVLGESGGQYRMVRIPFSLKSLCYAWSRTGFALGGIIAWIVTLVTFGEHQRLHDFGFVVPLLLAVSCTAAYAFVMIYPRRKMPSYARACQLGQIVGLNDRGWAALRILYSRDPVTGDPAGPLDTLTVR